MIFDAHFHLPVCLERGLPLYDDKNYSALSCAHSFEEWAAQWNYVQNQNNFVKDNFFLSYGMHPQSAGAFSDEDVKKTADFLESILKSEKISAIGEAGFDYFTLEYKESAEMQEKMFQIQLELAIAYNKPLVIHCRKANHKLFEYSRELARCRAVLFHSFMGPAAEALSLCRHNINAFFSFGKQIFNNNKKAIECVKTLPLENLLLETDAPFQTLKGEINTLPQEINDVYHEASRLRNAQSFENFCSTIAKNTRELLGK